MINQSNLVITPATWSQRINTLAKTPTGLYNLVGWYGSTHGAAMWRKADEFLELFERMNVIGFDPQVDEWEVFYAAVEAEILATASVIIIRLENNELLNGSLGSIAEIGMALISASLRGQIVIVSIEEGLLTSLNEPGSIAQYMMVEMSLEQLEKTPDIGQYLRIHRGNDLRELAILTCQTVHQQYEQGVQGLDYKQFLAKKARRSKNFPLRILLGGSGGAYTELYEDIFRQKKRLLIANYRPEDQIKIISEGAISEAWKIPYGSIDNIGVALATRTLLAIETEFKHEADVLLLPIISEAASKAASTEIGLLLLYALTTGQDVKIFLEPFDPVDYIHQQLKDVDLKNCIDEKSTRIALQEANVSAEILSIAVKNEVAETFKLFKALRYGGNPPSFKQVKNSLLGKTEAFHQADNIRRVRTLVQAHVERLYADERFPNFFSYSNQIKVNH